MRFGAFVPYIVAKPTDRETFLTFCKRIDDGPYATLAHGERTAWNTLEHFTALAAAAFHPPRRRRARPQPRAALEPHAEPADAPGGVRRQARRDDRRALRRAL